MTENNFLFHKEEEKFFLSLLPDNLFNLLFKRNQLNLKFQSTSQDNYNYFCLIQSILINLITLNLFLLFEMQTISQNQQPWFLS